MAKPEKNLNNSLRDIILNTKVPLVLPNFPTNWSCFNGNLETWCKCFDDQSESVPVFEVIACSDGNAPQWERKRQSKTMTTSEFLEQHRHPQNYWSAFNYKRASEIPKQCLADIDFSCFGFPDSREELTLWLGSAGANTPCHYDTFGVNIVVQVYGSKSWLLFPPSTALTTTRIPYEESSVYCCENFYAPGLEQMEKLDQYHSMAYHCVLQAGDVLIVPRHWWHYVESLDTSLSVNFWVPLHCDMDVSFDEIIVKHIVESFVKGESEEVKRYLLNPNQLEEIVDKPSELIGKFADVVNHYQSGACNRKLCDTNYLDPVSLDEQISNTEQPIVPLQVMPRAAYKKLLAKNNQRHNDTIIENSPMSATMELLINSMCTPSTITCIKNEFFKRGQTSISVSHSSHTQ